MLNTKRSNRLNEMVKQQEYTACIRCKQELQLKVKFCPFCSVAQIVQAQTLPAEPEETSTIPQEIVSDLPESTVSETLSEAQNNEAADTSVVVKHITKQGKE